MDAATRLINNGLTDATKALARVLGTKISPANFELQRTDGEALNYSTKEGKKVHVLKTELVGELTGLCHLILSEKEVLKIQNHALPEEVLIENNPETRLMKLEFLTETVNMVAGAFISQLANCFKLEVYGSVPSLHTMPAEEVNKYIQAESLVHDSKVQFSTTLQASLINVSPDFVWLLQQNFMEHVEANAASILSQSTPQR